MFGFLWGVVKRNITYNEDNSANLNHDESFTAAVQDEDGVQSKPELISSTMSSDQVAACLIEHNCREITSEIDFEGCSSDVLSRGGFGSIYKGSLRNGQPVAIKCIEVSGNWGSWKLKKKSVKHAAQELYVWSKCDHQGILKFLGFARFEGQILLVSPWMKNGSLVQYIEQNPQFDRFQPSLELASAVAYLHDVGIVHGDIKSDNVIISDDRHVQLGDFGSASLLEYASVSFTKTGFHGTLRFMAPEILSGEAEKPTKESDVYALGMTIFHMMTGEVPFANLLDRTIPIMVAIDKIKPNRPHFNEVFADRPAEDKLWSLLNQCWDYDPEHRPTAIGVKESLLELEHSTIAHIMRMLSDFSRVEHPPKSVFPYARDPTLSARAWGPNPSMQVAHMTVVSLPRQSVKKALVVGINYPSLDKDKRLYYAVNDAKLWRETFMGKGVEPENLKIITDDGNMQYAPTFNALLRHIKWLVEDARDGDSLFFVFSGHALLTHNFGPSILTADKVIFPRSLLERELVMSIPAGVDLQIFFDCSHSAGMIGLQYCLGRMSKLSPPCDLRALEPTTFSAEHEPSESQATEQPTKPRQPISHSPPHGSIHDVSTTRDPAPLPLPEPITSDKADLDTFGIMPRRARQVVVGAPPSTGTVLTSPLTRSWYEPTTTTRSSDFASRRVKEAALVSDYFEERNDGFVRPAGTVMVWASSGESQTAFDIYGKHRHGVFTKAMCDALEQFNTCRDVWSYLVQEIEKENSLRKKRDMLKAVDSRPLPSSRIQYAEVWSSQVLSKSFSTLPMPVLSKSILE